ncbi:diguanylate cyclase [Alkaliphilus serpentinus]|uniref:Diguanylate cyclase n=1 Tax=Alkaliphilus serpentinus TaxID=1482731 RepID=A0A833M9N6_9FIRM|nr:diguanylate cyclase [Alkaliphilus serpentinus]KAB3529029.1 diguanylate cyclase [Alkaliphilus serpentinus]
MDLINNRYKIEESLEQENLYNKFVALDLMQKNKKITLYVINYSSHTMDFVDYCSKNFYEFSAYHHDNILRVFSYGIIETIDDKKISERKYFYTTEYIEDQNILGRKKSFTKEEILEIYEQLANILDYLHFKGIIYKYLSIDTIHIYYINGKLAVKLQDLITVKKHEISKRYHEHLTVNCRAPEITYGIELGYYTDIYSLGAFIFYLYSHEDHQYHKLMAKKDKGIDQLKWENAFFETLMKMTSLDFTERYQSIHELNARIKEIYQLDYNIEKKESLEKLNFKIPIIGRDLEIRKVLNLTGDTNRNLVLIHGDKGIGKTRIQNEIKYKMKWMGCSLFNASISNQEEDFYKVAARILKEVLRIAPNAIIDKYCDELVKILPEIGLNRRITPSRPLPEDKELLKLFDRVSNFIIESVGTQLAVLTMDDVHYGDNTVYEFIDYFIKTCRLKKATIITALTFNRDEIENSLIKNYLSTWLMQDTTLEIKLGRLTIEETAKVIKHILGWNQEPLNFTTRIMKEADGVPAFIEGAIKELYSQKAIIVDYSDRHKGFSWHKTTDDCSNLKLPENLDEAAIKQLNNFDEITRNILEVISIFNTAVSKEIISYIIREEEDYTSHLGLLTQLKILNEKLEDWGYTYGFYNKNIKTYIYHNIENERKVKLHNDASDILEYLYKKEGRENKDELIFHLLQSDQRDKAIDYCIAAGDSMSNLKIYSQAMVFYDRGYKLLGVNDQIKRYKLLIKIADANQSQGKNTEALKYYIQAVKIAEKYDPFVVVDTKNKMGNIHLNRNEINAAEDLFKVCLEKAKKLRYEDGILKAAYLLSRAYMFAGRIDDLGKVVEEYLEYAKKVGLDDYYGLMMSQKGVFNVYKGNVEMGMACFKNSVIHLEKGNKPQDTVRPINNIGAILQDYYQDSVKAREYFNKSLNIAIKFNRIDDILTASNNIADSLMQDHEFDRAIEVLSKNITLAQEYEEKTISIIGYTNLIECYIHTGNYKLAYNCLMKTKDLLKTYPEGGLYKENYLMISAQFYLKMGDYKKAKESLEGYFQEASQKDERNRLLMEKTAFYVDYHMDNSTSLKVLLDIIGKYENKTYIRDYRAALIEASFFFYDLNDLEKAKELLTEDEGLVDKYDNKSLHIQRIFLDAMINQPNNIISIFEETLIPLLKTNNKEVKWKVYKRLAEAYLERKDYYRAASCYFTVLEIIQLLLNRTPDEFRESYILREDKYKIKHQLLIMEKAISKGAIDIKALPEIIAEGFDFNDFFDVTRFQDLFQNPAFYQLAFEQYKSLFPIEVEDIEQLMEALTNDVTYNLDMLTKLAGKHVLATGGVLLGVNETGLDVIASFGNKILPEDIQHLLEKSTMHSGGLLIENNVLQPMDGGESHKDIRALIVLPIVSKIRSSQVKSNLRRDSRLDQEKIIGYLYMETDKIFNNFSQETLRECAKLVPLAGVMINNYYLRISSSIDKLTGVYVRKHFEKVFNDELEYAIEGDLQFSIIMCDIDHFKVVNDTYGHQKGDMVLAKLGKIILSNIRETDYPARYGGEEFIILLTGATKEDAYNVAEKIRTSIHEAKLLGDDEDLTISCGISSFPHDGMNKDSLIERADQALYAAKEKGRNQSVLWEEGISFVDKRIDKLAGIVTGNTVQDQRNVLVIAEAIELVTEYGTTEEKFFTILGRLIEILEAEEGILFTLKEGVITGEYGRKRFIDTWLNEMNYNSKLIERVIQTKQGEHLIDWEDASQIDIFTGTPNWKSVIVTPILYNGELKGIVYLSSSVKEKEFDFNAYNLAKITSNILGPVIE